MNLSAGLYPLIGYTHDLCYNRKSACKKIVRVLYIIQHTRYTIDIHEKSIFSTGRASIQCTRKACDCIMFSFLAGVGIGATPHQVHMWIDIALGCQFQAYFRCSLSGRHSKYQLDVHFGASSVARDFCALSVYCSTLPLLCGHIAFIW